MSSSPRQAPESASSAIAPDKPPASPFHYFEVTLPAGHKSMTARLSPGGAGVASTDSSDRMACEAQARALGRQQGEAEARANFEQQLARERLSLSKALADFARDRAAFYQKIEQEAVQLALSIARKVLHREAQVDPLLLMGVVRVALEQMEGATGVVVAVHPQQAEDMRRFLAMHMDPGALPEIAEDPAITLGECLLRTSMGTAKIGIEVQLKEIEQGLMDLLAARPQENP
jgi:flagellar assembly protein FliH